MRRRTEQNQWLSVLVFNDVTKSVTKKEARRIGRQPGQLTIETRADNREGVVDLNG